MNTLEEAIESNFARQPMPNRVGQTQESPSRDGESRQMDDQPSSKNVTPSRETGLKKEGNNSRSRTSSINQSHVGFTRNVGGNIVSETIIEHQPIVRGVFERPGSMVYTNVLPQTQETFVVQGGQSKANYYATVTERVVEKNTDDQRMIMRLKEQNEELLTLLQKSETVDNDVILQLRRTIENYHSRFVELEDKLTRTSRERDEHALKLESKVDLNNSLKDKLEEAEHDCRLLRGRVQKLESEKIGLNSENTDLEAQIRKLTSELSSKNLSHDLSINELTNKLKAAEDKTRHAERMVHDAEEEITRLTRELRDKGQAIQTLHERNSSEKVNITTSKLVHMTDNSEVENMSSSYEAKLRAKNQEINELRSKLDAAESKIRSLESKLQDEAERADKEKRGLKAEIERLESDKNALLQKVGDLQRKNEDLSRQLAETKDKLDQTARIAENLKTNNKQLESDLEALRNEKSALAADKKKLEAAVADLESELQKLKKQLEAKTERIAVLEAELEEKDKKITNLTKTIKDLEELIDDLKYQIKGLERTIATNERTLPEDIKVLNDEIERLQDIIKQLSDQAISKEEELMARIEELEAYISELEEKNAKLAQEIELYEQRIDEVEAEVSELTDLSEKLACDNTTLQKKVEILTSQLQAMVTLHKGNGDKSDISDRLAFQLKRLIDFVSPTNLEQSEGSRDRTIGQTARGCCQPSQRETHFH